MYDNLLKHIYVEFKLGEKFSIDQWHLLHESDGQVFGIDEIVSIVSKFISNSNIGASETHLVMTKEDFKEIKNFPYENIKITFNVTINPQKRNSRQGNYSIKSRPGYPVIEIIANGNNVKELASQCNKAVCHELIHGDENAGLIGNAGTTLQKIHTNNHYYDYISQKARDLKDKELRKLFLFLYWSDFGERKAFIGTLYGELLKHKEEIYDSQSAYEVLHKTEEWKGIKSWERLVNHLNDYLGDTEKEKETLNTYNKITGENLSNYPSFLQKINRRWRKLKHAIDKRVSKLLYRVYLQSLNYGGTIDIDEY